MTSSPSIVFFQDDLQMKDNPALAAAAHRGNPLICLFVWNPNASGYAKAGAASRWWLHHSLHTLAANLAKAGNTLILRIRHAPEVIAGLVRQLGISHLYWNRPCEPTALEEEQKILKFLESEHPRATLFHANTLVDPSSVQTQAGQPYSVFTPFWKRFQTYFTIEPPLQIPLNFPSPPSVKVQTNPLSSLELLPSFDWAHGLRKAWTPGEDGAQTFLRKFLHALAQIYETERNRPVAGNGSLDAEVTRLSSSESSIRLCKVGNSIRMERTWAAGFRNSPTSHMHGFTHPGKLLRLCYRTSVLQETDVELGKHIPSQL